MTGMGGFAGVVAADTGAGANANVGVVELG